MKIICLTEETVETLYLLGREDFILGVSQYVERPPEAKKHPIVSQFIRSDIEKIVAMKPDLVIGFSDLQKDIASELIGRGISVLVTNQRSLDEILNNILLISRLVGEEQKGLELISIFKDKIDAIKRRSELFKLKPKVYFEEWDHPRFSCIKWVSELIEVCGGVNIFSDRVGSLAKEREVKDEEVILRNPDLIFGCWCGKKVNIDSFMTRYPNITATQEKCIWELSPAIFLQPGPALFIDGLDQMFEKIETVATLTASKKLPY
jgi:iron complex transport system substrate-binding protein